MEPCQGHTRRGRLGGVAWGVESNQAEAQLLVRTPRLPWGSAKTAAREIHVEHVAVGSETVRKSRER